MYLNIKICQERVKTLQNRIKTVCVGVRSVMWISCDWTRAHFIHEQTRLTETLVCEQRWLWRGAVCDRRPAPVPVHDADNNRWTDTTPDSHRTPDEGSGKCAVVVRYILQIFYYNKWLQLKLFEIKMAWNFAIIFTKVITVNNIITVLLKCTGNVPEVLKSILKTENLGWVTYSIIWNHALLQ